MDSHFFVSLGVYKPLSVALGKTPGLPLGLVTVNPFILLGALS